MTTAVSTWPQRYYACKEVQTSYSDTQQCGLIEVSLHSQIYILNCFYCADEFPIWNWENFVVHMNTQHIQTYEVAKEQQHEYVENVQLVEITIVDNLKGDSDDLMPPIIEQECLSVEALADEDEHENNIEFVSTGSNEHTESNNYTEYDNEELIAPVVEGVTEMLSEVHAGKTEAAIVFKGVTITPIRAKTTKPHNPSPKDNRNGRQQKHGPKEDNTDLDEVVLFEKPYDTDVSDDGTGEDKEPTFSRNCIFFTKTDPAIVGHFLDLLRKHPVLHNYRRRPVEAYDTAVAAITHELNAKWHLDVRQPSVAESVMRTRYWYKYVLQRLADKPQNYRCKFWPYFKKCREFLPSHNLVQPPARLSCPICRKFFLNTVQLQNHKFIEHREGELYYKCPHCDRRFAHPGERQQHMRSEHKRIKVAKAVETAASVVDAGSVCDVCGKQFTTVAICKQHRKRHDKPLFNCDLCPKSFHLSFLLKEHKRYHEQKFEFVCDECGHAFLHKRTLKQHIKGVHKREIRCKICGIAYTNHMSVVRHLKRDHLVLEGSNEELEQRLIANKIQRVLDPETHTYNFVCSLCGMKCSGKRPFGLVRHMMKKHGYVPIDQKWRIRKPRKSKKSASATADDITNAHSSDDDVHDEHVTEDREEMNGIQVDSSDIIEEEVLEDEAVESENEKPEAEENVVQPVDGVVQQLVVNGVIQTPNATTAVRKIINILTKPN